MSRCSRHEYAGNLSSPRHPRQRHRDHQETAAGNDAAFIRDKNKDIIWLQPNQLQKGTDKLDPDCRQHDTIEAPVGLGNASADGNAPLAIAQTALIRLADIRADDGTVAMNFKIITVGKIRTAAMNGRIGNDVPIRVQNKNRPNKIHAAGKICQDMLIDGLSVACIDIAQFKHDKAQRRIIHLDMLIHMSRNSSGEVRAGQFGAFPCLRAHLPDGDPDDRQQDQGGQNAAKEQRSRLEPFRGDRGAGTQLIQRTPRRNAVTLDYFWDQ